MSKAPGRLNRQTATSAVSPHSKSSLSLICRAALGHTTVTRDGIVCLRPSPGLSFVRANTTIDATEIVGVLGEVAVTERALLDGTRIEGRVHATLPVENLGPYQDLEPPDGWLVVHVPGWDTATVKLWPDDLDLDGAPQLVRDLAVRGLWLEQESIALDPRLPQALEALVGA